MRDLKDALRETPNASIDALVEATNLKTEEVRNLIHLVGKPTSIDSSFQEGGSTEVDGLHEMLADTNNDFVSDVEEDSTRDYVKDKLGSVLDERELFVLVNRYGIGDVHERRWRRWPSL